MTQPAMTESAMTESAMTESAMTERAGQHATQPSPFAVTALGVGDAFSAQFYASHMLVEAGGTTLLVDSPHPVRKALHEATAGRVDVDALSAVVLTHLHADHVSGLEPLAFFWHFALKRRLPLIAHEAVVERLWDGHLAVGMDTLRDSHGTPTHMGFADYFEWIPLPDDAPLEFQDVRLEARLTKHHVATTALRVHHGGRVLGYSADTAFDPALIDWLADADHILHETNLGTHTPYTDLAALPAPLRAKMHAYHYPDQLAGLLQSPAADVPVPLLAQGQRIVL